MKKQGQLLGSLATVVVVLMAFQSVGQIAFQNTFTNPDSVKSDYGYSVVQLGDESYVVAGTSVDLDNYTGQGLLKRVDQYGNEMWSYYFSHPALSSSDLEFSSIQKTDDNNLIVTGVVNYGFSNSNYYDAFLAKFDTLGNLLWQRNYGGDYRQWTKQVKETNDNGFVFCGYNEYLGSASSISFYLVRTDDGGDTLWTRTYPNGYQQTAEAVEQTSDDGFVFVGHSNSHAFSGVGFVIKTDSQGDTLWTKYLTELNDSYASDVTTATNGNIIVSGYSQLTGCTRPFLLELDLSGHLLWYKVYNEGPCGWGYSVTKTHDDGYAVFGMDSDSTGNDAYLLKTDNQGNLQWYNSFDESEVDYGYSLRQTADNGFIMTGITGVGSQKSVLLIKTDGNGEVSGVESLSHELVDVVVYPNPTSENITVEIPKSLNANFIKVYAINGQELLHQSIQSEKQVSLNVSNFAAGVYYLFIDGGVTKKIVKQ